MSLTEKQELEMYANIAVIKNNCVRCTSVQADHETRLKMLEKSYWIFVGVSSVITFVLPFIIQHFMK